MRLNILTSVKSMSYIHDKKHLQYLREFQHKFVLVPTDKAGKNVIVVCRKYYLDVVMDELKTIKTTYVHENKELSH